MSRTARDGIIAAVIIVVGVIVYFFYFSPSSPEAPAPSSSPAVAQNLIWPSGDFTNANWVKYDVTVDAVSGAAPDGKGAADRLAATTDNGRHSIHISGGGTAPGAVYTFSLYVKPMELSAIRLEMGDSKQPGKYGTLVCNLLNGGSVKKDVDVSDGGVEPAANGWSRCWAAMPFTGGGVSLNVDVLNASGSYIYQGDGRSGLLVWGAQFERGNKPASYVATTAAAK